MCGLKWPYLDYAMGYRARRRGHELRGLLGAGRLDDGEACDLQIRAHERPGRLAHARVVVVAYLHGIAGDAHQGPIGAEPRIVGVGCVTHTGVRLLVSEAVAVPDCDECRHQGAPFFPSWTLARAGRAYLDYDRPTKPSAWVRVPARTSSRRLGTELRKLA